MNRRNFFKYAAAGTAALAAAPLVLRASSKPISYGTVCPVGPPNPVWCNRCKVFHSPYDHAATMTEAKRRMSEWINNHIDELTFKSLSGMK